MDGFYRVSIPTKGRTRLEAICDYLDTTLWCDAEYLGSTTEALGQWATTVYNKYTADAVETLVELKEDNVTDIYYLKDADTIRHEKYMEG